MRSLVIAIVVASLAILGFYAYQSSQKNAVLQAELDARETALTTLEGEKAVLEKQVAALHGQLDKLAAEVEAAKAAAAEAASEAAAPETPAAEAPATEAPATEAPAPEAPAPNP